MLVAAALLTSACAVHQPYTRPPMPAPPTYKEIAGGNNQWKTAQPNDGAIRGDWWEMFNDPTLNHLEQLVVVDNQNLKAAQAQFRQARALVALNRAGYYPTVTTSPAIGVGQNGRAGVSNNPNVPSGGIGGVFTEFSLPVGVSWEPDLWGRIGFSVAGAVASAQVTAADLVNLRLSLQAELAADYFAMHGIDMEIKLLADNIKAYEQALQLTINRFNGGVASKVDVEQAQSQLDSTRASAADLEITRAQYEHAIAVLTGQAPSNLTLPPGTITGPPPPIPAGVPSELLQRRPDIAASERQVAAANANIGLARTAYFPALSLTASGGFQGTSLVNLFAWSSRFWSLGPTLAYTVLDFGRRRAQVAETEAAYDTTVANYRQAVLAGFQEVEDNLAALKHLGTEAAYQRSATQSAEESLRLELDRYKAGTVGYLEVITSQTIALNDERDSVIILQRQMSAAVNLIRALGGGWNESQLPSAGAIKSAGLGAMPASGATAAPVPVNTAPQPQQH